MRARRNNFFPWFILFPMKWVNNGVESSFLTVDFSIMPNYFAIIKMLLGMIGCYRPVLRVLNYLLYSFVTSSCGRRISTIISILLISSQETLLITNSRWIALIVASFIASLYPKACNHAFISSMVWTIDG